MAKNYIEKGDAPAVPAPTGGVSSGDYFIVGALCGIAATDAEETELVAMDRGGAWTLVKATGVTYSPGDIAYWDVADGNFNADTGNNAGAIVLEAAGSSDTTFVGILLPAVFASTAALTTRVTEIEKLVQTMPAAGTQKGMTVSDTYAVMTEDGLTWDADLVEARDVIEFEFGWKVDGMNAAGQVTFSLLLGSLELGTVVISTADTNDWASLKGSITFKAVGSSSTVDIVLEKTGSDGGTVTITKTMTFAATGPATTSAVVLKARAKAATGNAANLTTQHIGHGHLKKAAA